MTETEEQYMKQLKQECKEGSSSSCECLGVIYSTDSDTEQDKIRAVFYYKAACILKSQTACDALARLKGEML